ncbi:MAG: carboxypeptidase regulatory-like domain-containing protein [Chloracidobacterium sp.]|nr:carboxypeptidase regulatory-like domain-containing protein [Chloracidobacterium sp.]
MSNISISGRIIASAGRGITNAFVTLIDQNNVERHITTGRNGYFQFDNVTAGQDYTISVTQRRFMFTSQSFSRSGPPSDVNFIGAR